MRPIVKMSICSCIIKKIQKTFLICLEFGLTQYFKFFDRKNELICTTQTAIHMVVQIETVTKINIEKTIITKKNLWPSRSVLFANTIIIKHIVDFWWIASYFSFQQEKQNQFWIEE